MSQPEHVAPTGSRLYRGLAVCGRSSAAADYQQVLGPAANNNKNENDLKSPISYDHKALQPIADPRGNVIKALTRFFDIFKKEWQPKNLALPSASPGSGSYYDEWAKLLSDPQLLPKPLVKASAHEQS